MFVRDDHDGIRLVEALQHNINHLCDDEVGKQRVHRLVPTIEEARRGEDEEVDEHNNFTDGELRPCIENDGDNLRPVEASARAHDDADAEARHHAAEDRGEEGIIRHLGDIVQQTRPDREHDDREHRRERKVLADLLVPHVDERDVVEYEKNAEPHACDRLRHDREADHRRRQ